MTDLEKYNDLGGDLELERILSLPTDEEQLIQLAIFVRKLWGLPRSAKPKFGSRIGKLSPLLERFDPKAMTFREP